MGAAPEPQETSVNRVLAALLASALVLTACGGDEAEAEPAEPEQAQPVSEPEPEPDEEPEPEPEDTRPRSVLTGEPVDEDVLERPLLIVKIENSPESRPQTGLDAADVVIEEVVEAGVTRFMALFQSEIPTDVGPIRSARPVDAQLISSFGRSGFIYSGARQEVRGLLAGTPAIRIAEGGPGFYRLGERRAPHNLYNRLPQALEAVEARDPEVLESPGWVFDEQPPAGAVSCPTSSATRCEDPGADIEIAMSGGFRTGWAYDTQHGLYRRLQNGAPFLVTGADSVGAANVVVLATRHYLGAPNCHGARCPETDATTDGDRAVVLRDGQRYEATWRKPNAAADIELLTVDGEPFPLKPGRTWMHLPSSASMPVPLG
jgi:hypothetical protein